MRNNTLARRFMLHHLTNPEMWKAYESLALEAIATGRESIGVGALTEVLRWDAYDVGDKAEGYKVSNDFRAFYARMFAHVHPEHQNLFRYKASAADYLDYECLMRGDAKGALNWVDPQLPLKFEVAGVKIEFAKS